MSASPRIITLLYHRICEPDTNPWGICVSPKHFSEQMGVVKKCLPVITIEEILQQVTKGKIPETFACITFDDGYEDNVTTALPILKQYQCPATFFIATAFIESPVPFWWDELEMICLHSKKLPAGLILSINDIVHHFNFETELSNDDWQQHLLWKWYEEAPALRCQSFIAIWNLLRPLSYSIIENLMNDIRLWSGNYYQTRLPMNRKQLQHVNCEKLATIGLHTHTHPDLASQNMETQIYDIEKGKRILAEQFETDSSLLAYPYGRFTETTISAVKKIGLTGCFTTESSPITAASDIAKLGRYQVFDWNAEEFEKKLLSWLST